MPLLKSPKGGSIALKGDTERYKQTYSYTGILEKLSIRISAWSALMSILRDDGQAVCPRQIEGNLFAIYVCVNAQRHAKSRLPGTSDLLKMFV